MVKQTPLTFSSSWCLQFTWTTSWDASKPRYWAAQSFSTALLETCKPEGGDYKVLGKAAAFFPTRRAGEVHPEAQVVSCFMVLCHDFGNASGI